LLTCWGDDVSEPFPNYGIVIIVLGLLLIIVTISAVFVYRYPSTESLGVRQ